MKLPSRGADRETELEQFGLELQEIDRKTGFKLSSRGWCYVLEGLRLINKSEFDHVQKLINECRKKGYLPIDFVAEEDARSFSGVWEPDDKSPREDLRAWIHSTLKAGEIYRPNYWDGEQYYIQMLVEKVDLVTLFKPVCEKYFIPIATAKGWSSILQRAEMAERFMEMEDTGHIPVLLYAGDFDPAGLNISGFLMENFRDIELGTDWSPENLIIDRFGLNYGFIVDNNLTWIDNLETGSGGVIAVKQGDKIVQGRSNNGRPHPDFNKPYVQEYLSKYGVRKCEANAIVVRPESGRQLCEDAVVKYLGSGALGRFAKKKKIIVDSFNKVLDDLELREVLLNAYETLNASEEE